MLRSCITMALGCLLLLIAGCGGDPGAGAQRAKTVPFSGKITVDGKSPGVVKVQFLPIGSEGGVRTAYAEVKEDGSFSATTYVTGDGIVPGKYTARVGSEADGASTDPSAMMAAVMGASIETMEIDVPADGLPGVDLNFKSSTGGKKSGGAMLGN